MRRLVIYYKNKLCNFIFLVWQISSSHHSNIIIEAPPTAITSSAKLLPLHFSNKCCKFPSATSEDEHQSIRKSWNLWRLSLLKRTVRACVIQNPAKWNTLKILKNKEVGVYSSFIHDAGQHTC